MIGPVLFRCRAGYPQARGMNFEVLHICLEICKLKKIYSWLCTWALSASN